ncbi:hypothetical protein M433DRAFT_116979 [Acidomyces richmondensis BFW]|nr:hypothetical protein M433DRAFT_116979 [Acidomyces richmondensis BFW]
MATRVAYEVEIPCTKSLSTMNMATTTPATNPPSSGHQRQRTSSNSRSRVPSRPTTPLRPPSRTSLRASQTTPSGSLAALSASDFPLAGLEPAFAELSDSMADLEANMMHLQLLNESLGRFNENFAAFLYGLNMSAFCVDFPEAPIPQSFTQHKDIASSQQLADSPFRDRAGAEPTEATFLTTDTSFVENPPTSSKATSKYSSVPPSTSSARQSAAAPGRGSAPRGGARAGGAGAGRGVARGSVSRGSSGIGRGGTTRGRGAVR